MTEIESEVLEDKQLACDLIEIGATRAAAALIKENIEAAADDFLPLQKVRVLTHKLNALLNAFDRAQDDLDNYKGYIAQKEAETAQQADTEGKGE